MTLYAFNQTTGEYWRIRVTPTWARRHDNGHLISIGLNLETDISARAWAVARRRFRAVSVTREQWNHSGCQSSCTQRGNTECRW